MTGLRVAEDDLPPNGKICLVVAVTDEYGLSWRVLSTTFSSLLKATGAGRRVPTVIRASTWDLASNGSCLRKGPTPRVALPMFSCRPVLVAVRSNEAQATLWHDIYSNGITQMNDSTLAI